MPTFEVILRYPGPGGRRSGQPGPTHDSPSDSRPSAGSGEQRVERVDGADDYQQEGPMTTFFRRGDGRAVIDSWSTRIASFRTADLLAIRRHETAAGQLRAIAGG